MCRISQSEANRSDCSPWQKTDCQCIAMRKYVNVNSSGHDSCPRRKHFHYLVDMARIDLCFR